MVVAIKNIQTATKAIAAAFCFIVLSRSSELGSAGLCFFRMSRNTINGIAQMAQRDTYTQTTADSLGFIINMSVITNAICSKQKRNMVKAKIDAFCVLFIFISFPPFIAFKSQISFLNVKQTRKYVLNAQK